MCSIKLNRLPIKNTAGFLSKELCLPSCREYVLA